MSSQIVYVCLLVVVCLCVKGAVFDRDKRQALLCWTVNPCDFQTMCGNGGTCLKNETTCKIFCECPTDYTGLQCETALEDPSSTSSANSTDCGVDPCLTSSISCSNGGTCMWNETSCSVSCQCATGYSGDTCDEVNPVLSGVTVNPVNVSSCPFNQCKWSSSICVHGTCTQNSKCGIDCNCNPGYTGELCETLITTTTTGPERSTTPTSTLATTTLRPFEERNCGGGFVCYHGRCKTENGSSFCDCDKGHTGTFCTIPCSKECGDNGICDRYNFTSPEGCNCKYPYTGDICEEKVKVGGVISVSDDWKYWVIGSCVGLVLILSLLLVLAYFLVRKRNIFIMQVLYYFQPYEDDDGKPFDAFISYKSAPEDENFVYRTLYPELEKRRGFKLCLHQRDFTPGETIANNILWAIENSRRTILVLSPRYMESDFTRFEYQIAHNEMLKEKHKVIPLLLEDIAEKKDLMDKTLTSILKSITYIEWPNVSEEEEMLKKFWKRLELSLPKRKPGSDSETPESDPVGTYANSAYSSPIEMEMISVENSDKTAGKNISNSENLPETINNRPQNDTKEIINEKPMSNKELKSFFDEPANDDIFDKMREKAFEYEQSLDL